MNTSSQNIKLLIHNFVEGELTEVQTDTLWAHLLGNTDDFEYMQTLATLKKMGAEGRFAKSASDHEDTPAQIFALGQNNHIYTYAKQYLAAAAILIMSLAVLFNVISGEETAADFSPIAMIEYDIERSAEELTTFDSSLQRAVSQSSFGNLDAALITLGQAEKLAAGDLSRQTELGLVKGSILYNSGKYAEAATIFSDVKETGYDKLSLEKSTWYLANTQIQLNDLDAARENIRKVVEMDGSFSRVATKALEAL